MNKIEKIEKEIKRRIEETINDTSIVDTESLIISKTLTSLHNFVVSLYKEPEDKNFEDALAKEWQGYNNRGAATVDALEDNTQELAFAKGFYSGAQWKEQKYNVSVSEDLNEAAHNVLESILNKHEIINIGSCLDTFKLGAQWKEQQMLKDAIICKAYNPDIEGIELDGIVEILPSGLHLNPEKFKAGDKVKVIVIKAE